MVDRFLNMINFEKNKYLLQKNRVTELENIHHGLIIHKKPMLAIRIFQIMQDIAAAKMHALGILISLYDAEQQWQRQLNTMKKGKQRHVSLGQNAPIMVQRAAAWLSHKTGTMSNPCTY